MKKGPIETSDIDKQDLFPCLVNGGDKSRFEQFKASSNYLEEPLFNELKNDSDHFTNDAVQLLKFHGSYQQDNRENRQKGSNKDWQLMLRLRSPGGTIPSSLFIALNDLSNRLGNQTLRATTRQAFQMHGIRKENLKEVIGIIIKSMGSTLAACGDINRNVMAPAAPFSHGGYPIARKLANDIADLLTPIKAEETYLDIWVDGDLTYRIKSSEKVKRVKERQLKGGIFSGDTKEPLYGKTYLPRKFKCGVTVPGDNSIDILTQDIGLVAFTSKSGQLEGCNVYIGGGMGRTHNNDETFARIADPLGYVSAEHILDLVQSILALQRDYGDRKTRRHSRMKYLIHTKKIDWFTKTLKSKYFKYTINELRTEPTPQLVDYLGWHRQTTNLSFVGIPLLSGRLDNKLKTNLVKIVDKFKLEIRITPNQDLLLCNIGNFQKNAVRHSLMEMGISNPENPNPIRRHALACPALPLCGLAITEAERSLPDILDRIENQLKIKKINKTILVRMTGCPNGCARPYMAELALVGSGVDQYQLWLGGSRNLQRLAKPYIQKMPLEKLELTLEPLLTSWKSASKSISFGDHINEMGDQLVNQLLSGAQEP